MLGFLTLVEVGPPNNNYAAFVGRFNDYIFAFFLDFSVPNALPKKDCLGVTIEFKFVDIVATFFDEKI